MVLAMHESKLDVVAEHAVVIVGGGPTGLMLAAELALARVDVAIVERRVNQDVLGTRAGGLHARTLELLDQRGVVERFLAQGKTMQTASLGTGPLDLSDFPTRHPYGLALSQNHIERILAEWVAELGVRFYRDSEVTSFQQHDSVVHVALADGRQLRARYLVGCDGGRSSIRKQAGIEFPGWEASTSYLIAEVEMREEGPWGMRRDAKGVYAMGKMEDGKRVRVVLREEETGRTAEPTLEELRAALIALYGSDFGVQDVTWLSWFTDATRQAARYRERRVMLAGDAAHVHSPNGGQGLNLGVHDAVNLGWKLARVVHGTSPESLLDTYQAERHPVTARLLRATMAITALSRGDERTEALRETVGGLLGLEAARKQMAGMLSGLDIRYELGQGHDLLGRRMPDVELRLEGSPRRVYTLLHAGRPVLLNLGDPAALDITPWVDVVRWVNARYDGAWELPVLGVVATRPAAVLIRPDGYVAWVGDGTDAGLHDALRTWFGAGATRPNHAA